MPINVEFKTDVAGVRELARWFGTGAESVHDAGSAAICVKSDAEGDWGGASGTAFLGSMGMFINGIDAVGADMRSGKSAIEAFADDAHTCQSRLEQAREVARQGGLTVSDTEISDPDPAPPFPAELGDNPTPEAKVAHAEAQAAVAKHEKQVRAYKEAETIAQSARESQRSGVNHLAKFGETQLRHTKWPFTAADIAAGLGKEGLTARSTKWTKIAEANRTTAQSALRVLNASDDVSDPAVQAAKNALRDSLPEYLDASSKPSVRIANSKITKLAFATAEDLNSVKNATSTLAKVGKNTLGKVPVIGGVITAGAIATDIATGDGSTESVAKAVVSGVGGMAAGAAVGSMIPVPVVGTVVGAAVGAGVGYVVDEWGDEIAHGAAEAAGVVGDFVGDLF